ncbi:unnamed protein product [Parajaminaea phylloscopi]
MQVDQAQVTPTLLIQWAQEGVRRLNVTQGEVTLSKVAEKRVERGQSTVITLELESGNLSDAEFFACSDLPVSRVQRPIAALTAPAIEVANVLAIDARRIVVGLTDDLRKKLGLPEVSFSLAATKTDLSSAASAAKQAQATNARLPTYSETKHQKWRCHRRVLDLSDDKRADLSARVIATPAVQLLLECVDKARDGVKTDMLRQFIANAITDPIVSPIRSFCQKKEVSWLL